jgi:hypothetical protein
MRLLSLYQYPRLLGLSTNTQREVNTSETFKTVKPSTGPKRGYAQVVDRTSYMRNEGRTVRPCIAPHDGPEYCMLSMPVGYITL